MDKNQTPNSPEIKEYNKYISLLVLLLFAVSCLFTYSGLKVGITWITNAFQNSLSSWIMILCYFLPVVCFGFYFYSSFVKPNKKITRIIYTSIVSAIAIFNLIGIAIYFPMYAQNNSLGVYESLPTIAFAFPYDALIINGIIIILQAYNISLLIKPNHKYSYIKTAFTSYGFFRYSRFGFIGVTVLALISMFFIGDFVNGFNSIENAAYDGKYVFLLLWILIIPLMNFIYFLVNPSIRKIKEKSKIILYSCAIGVNLLFTLLFAVFELTSPNFIVGVGKPLFLIDFTISVPVGPIILLIVTTVSTILFAIRLIKSILLYKNIESKKQNPQSK